MTPDFDDISPQAIDGLLCMVFIGGVIIGIVVTLLGVVIL